MRHVVVALRRVGTAREIRVDQIIGNRAEPARKGVETESVFNIEVRLMHMNTVVEFESVMMT